MSLLPDAIADDRFQAYDAVSQRLEGLSIPAVLVYLVDIVDPSVLPALAWQFHVEGYDSREAISIQRQQIRDSIRLHRRYGTPWAVRRVLELAGYTQVRIIENARVRQGYDGQCYYDGQAYYDGGLSAWATFEVQTGGQTKRYDGSYRYDNYIIFNGGSFLTPTELARIRRLIEGVKPVRSHLVNLRQYLLKYDGHAAFDGAHDFNGGLL